MKIRPNETEPLRFMPDADWRLMPPELRQSLTEYYRSGIMPPDQRLVAAINNDLYHLCRALDTTGGYTAVTQRICEFVYRFSPSWYAGYACIGSQEISERWCEAGGITGINLARFDALKRSPNERLNPEDYRNVRQAS